MNGNDLRGAGVAIAALLVLGACSSGTAPDLKPTRADITITGSTPGPLQLVVSTDFEEIVDDVTFEILQVVNNADTFSVTTLPHERTVALTDLGSVLVALTNHAEEPAQVRMRIELDSGQDPYDQSATMSLGGTLKYVFVFLERVF